MINFSKSNCLSVYNQNMYNVNKIRNNNKFDLWFKDDNKKELITKSNKNIVSKLYNLNKKIKSLNTQNIIRKNINVLLQNKHNKKKNTNKNKNENLSINNYNKSSFTIKKIKNRYLNNNIKYDNSINKVKCNIFKIRNVNNNKNVYNNNFDLYEKRTKVLINKLKIKNNHKEVLINYNFKNNKNNIEESFVEEKKIEFININKYDEFIEYLDNSNRPIKDNGRLNLHYNAFNIKPKLYNIEKINRLTESKCFTSRFNNNKELFNLKSKLIKNNVNPYTNNLYTLYNNFNSYNKIDKNLIKKHNTCHRFYLPSINTMIVDGPK